MDEEDVALREEEEQRVIEATIQNRLKELHGESPSRENSSIYRSDTQGSDNDKPGGGGFGSSLDQYNRSRTFSNSSNSSSAGTGASDLPRTPIRLFGGASSEELEPSDASTAIQLLAISPDDRRALESEMRAQLSHDTHRRMESEAEEARMRHVQEWYGSESGMRSRMREARLAELTALLERLGAAANGRAGDGLVGDQDGDEDDYEDRGVGRSVGAANNLGRLLRALEHSNLSGGGGVVAGGGGRNRNLEELMRLEAAFILGLDDETAQRTRRHLPGRRFSRRTSGSNEPDDNDSGGEAVNAEVFGYGGARPPSSVRGINRLMRRQARRGVSSTQLDTAALLMRGVSEEEQLAMAIAMSMQDSRQQEQQPPPQDIGGDQEESSSETATQQAVPPNVGHPYGPYESEADEESSSSESSSSSSSSDSSDDGSGEGGHTALHHDEEEVVSSGDGTGV